MGAVGVLPKTKTARCTPPQPILVFVVGVGDHVVPLDDLLAFASFGFAKCAFSSIEFMPAAPGCVGNIFVGQELDHGVFLGLGGRGESAIFPVSEEHFGGFLGIALRCCR